MPRPSKPWYWKARKEWYVKIDGERVRLGPDKKAATEQYRALMAPQKKLQRGQAIVLIDDFLEWCQKNRPASYSWYFQFLNPFCKIIDGLRVDDVTPEHVTEFIDKPTWGPSAKRAAVTAIKRAFNWAVKQQKIHTNPVKECSKEEATTRDLLITEEIHAELLSFATPEFAELLEMAWCTGARPFELYRLETRHLDLKNSRAIYPKAEAKGKKKPRVIYFSPKALEIVERNMQASGRVFRNTDGEPWTVYSINCAFLRIQTAMGLKASTKIKITPEALEAKMVMIRKNREKKNLMEENPKPPHSPAALHNLATKSLRSAAARKHVQKYHLYAYRHSFAHRKMSDGMDSMVVATLMGHSSVDMINRVYGHLNKNAAFLLAQASK